MLVFNAFYQKDLIKRMRINQYQGIFYKYTAFY